MEYLFGFKRAKIAVLDSNNKVVADKIYTLEGDGKGGTVSAKISGLEALTSSVSASDGVYFTSVAGIGSPKLEMEVIELSNEQKRDILGYIYEDGIIKGGKKTRPPYVAVILESSDKDGKGVFISLLKGKFTTDSVDLQTAEADKGPEGSTTTLSGTFETVGADGHAYMAGREADELFDYAKFEALVFPAATPPAG